MKLVFYPIDCFDLEEGNKFLAIRKGSEEKTDYSNCVYWGVKKDGRFWRKSGLKKWSLDTGITHFAEKPTFTIRPFRHPTENQIENLTKNQALEYFKKQPNLIPDFVEQVKKSLRNYKKIDT